MLANYLIGLREGLEAALVVSILAAYLVRTDHRAALRQVWLGAGLAIAVSLAVGAALTFGSRELPERTEQILGGTLSILAVALVTWMVLWMARAARGLSSELRGRVDVALAAGGWAVAVVALLAVGREGLETALFLWAAISAAGDTTAPLLGAALGLATAVGLGWAIYRGAVRLDLRKFFAWTGLGLVLVAGGVLTYGLHELVEAGVLPSLGTAFDVSAAVRPDSWYAALLRGTIGFRPEMSWLEVLAWLAYVPTLATVYARQVWPRATTPAAVAAERRTTPVA